MFVAGIGRSVITPPLPVALAGFGEPQLARDVHDDLEAIAVVLRSRNGGDGDGIAVCLVVCDLLGMSPEFSTPVRAAVAGALGLERAAVLVACTHTHSGPSAMRGTRALGWVTPEGYLDVLVEGCRAAAVTADANATPTATVRYGRAPLPDGLSINRRGHPYDPWFATLDLGDAGVLANVGVHPVALGPECLAVSRDWVGAFRDELDSRRGRPSVLLSSALGDVNPAHVHRQYNECQGDGFAEARELGVELAHVVDDALPHAETISGDVRVVASREFDVPIGGTPLAAARRDPTIRVELVEWEIGPVRVVSIPGEAFHQLGREVDEARGGRTILAGLAPSWHGYFPVPYVEGGYEEQTSFGRDAVAAIRKELLNVPHFGHRR